MHYVLFVTLMYAGFGIAAENHSFSNRKDCDAAVAEFKDRASDKIKVVAFCTKDGPATDVGNGTVLPSDRSDEGK